MSNKEYITAYEKTKFSAHSVKSSHEIVLSTLKIEGDKLNC